VLEVLVGHLATTTEALVAIQLFQRSSQTEVAAAVIKTRSAVMVVQVQAGPVFQKPVGPERRIKDMPEALGGLVRVLAVVLAVEVLVP
jgi:hypothetical protein